MGLHGAASLWLGALPSWALLPLSRSCHVRGERPSLRLEWKSKYMYPQDQDAASKVRLGLVCTESGIDIIYMQ